MDTKNIVPKKRIVVIGGGFAGLNFVKHIDLKYYDVVIIDRNNFHSFPPLFYQVASAGLEPASISFPLRREIRKLHHDNIRYHLGTVKAINTDAKFVETNLEQISYDILVIAAGTTNNFFNMPELKEKVYTIKSTSEAIRCRNDILDILEKAALESDPEKQRQMLSFVVVGGGPSGVEVAGALGEMKRYVIPQEYPSIPQENVSITLLEGAPRLLATMSEHSSAKALEGLKSLMVNVRTSTQMQGFENNEVILSDQSRLHASRLIWTAGVTGVTFELQGADKIEMGRGNRYPTDEFCAVKGVDDVYALGDISLMDGDPDFPKGHPQLAQVAIQQGRLLARNLTQVAKAYAGSRQPKLEAFRYKDKGSMATIGRNRAVVDLPHAHFAGFSAWIIWMFIHLISLLGMRNKITVLVNWVWSYFNYGTSLRLLIHPNKYPLRKHWEEI